MYNSSYLANRIWVFTFEKWSNIAKSKVQSKRTEKKDNLTSEREFIYRGSGQEWILDPKTKEKSVDEMNNRLYRRGVMYELTD